MLHRDKQLHANIIEDYSLASSDDRVRRSGECSDPLHSSDRISLLANILSHPAQQIPKLSLTDAISPG